MELFPLLFENSKSGLMLPSESTVVVVAVTSSIASCMWTLCFSLTEKHVYIHFLLPLRHLHSDFTCLNSEPFFLIGSGRVWFYMSQQWTVFLTGGGGWWMSCVSPHSSIWCTLNEILGLVKSMCTWYTNLSFSHSWFYAFFMFSVVSRGLRRAGVSSEVPVASGSAVRGREQGGSVTQMSGV